MFTPALAMRGLSPRVRGILKQRKAMSVYTRSIPACAGDPMAMVGAGVMGAVYPRVCGGSTEREFQAGIVQGLSPRVRGILDRRGVRQAGHRSIPACAGDPS